MSTPPFCSPYSLRSWGDPHSRKLLPQKGGDPA
jgi:hypothetical protein